MPILTRYNFLKRQGVEGMAAAILTLATAVIEAGWRINMADTDGTLHVELSGDVKTSAD